MKHMRVTPLDVAMFRDARPFDADDASGARLGSLLPLQMTMFGALRNLLLFEEAIPYEEFRAGKGSGRAVGNSPSDPGTLRIGPVWMAGERAGTKKALLPLPADVASVSVRGWAGEKGVKGYLRPIPAVTGSGTNLPEGLQPLWPEDAGPRTKIAFDLEGQALPSTQLKEYLLKEPVQLERVSSWFEVERRLGIERESSSFTAKEGRLYTAEFVRPREDAYYLVPIVEDSGELPVEERVLSLGGERRPCAFAVEFETEIVPWSLREEVKAKLVSGYRNGGIAFRIYLLTPAASTGGWRPAFREGVTLKAAAMGRPVWLSGWDSADRGGKGSPRKAVPYLPAGAVFFLEADWGLSAEETAEKILNEYWFQPALCESWDSLEAKAGFGMSLVGV